MPRRARVAALRRMAAQVLRGRQRAFVQFQDGPIFSKWRGPGGEIDSEPPLDAVRICVQYVPGDTIGGSGPPLSPHLPPPGQLSATQGPKFMSVEEERDLLAGLLEEKGNG